MKISPRTRFAIKTLVIVICATRLVMFSSDVSAAAIGVVAPPQFQDVLSDQVFLNDLNAERVANGEQPLVLNAQLDAAAQAKVEDMITKHYWAHFRPGDNKSPWAFIEEAGYNYTYAGENLAEGFRTEGGITNAWINSPEHRANMLSSHYTEVGFATGYMYLPDGTRVLLTDEMFGAR